jgi:hypothetical protein
MIDCRESVVGAGAASWTDACGSDHERCTDVGAAPIEDEQFVFEAADGPLTYGRPRRGTTALEAAVRSRDVEG